ncbi:serine hydrolase domain-containing protein [Halocynthiibacter styelae]|uniref:Serine hydrolase n=1 Tax=Halocynthiibacter styelae TaxID=2761955 RepID=A0A8J7IVE3_9RHOB|nr:serine hydrolase [Paenihalocynthiibacter styelae]MBI1493444.1 serine hydrolase [Paenihalocynthiibacter styelae]
MKRILKMILKIILVLAVITVVLGIWKREELVRLNAVLTLFSEDRIVQNFSHMDAAFLARDVARGDGSVSDLPVGADMVLPPSVAPWIEERSVTALLVMKGGEIRSEAYFLGTSSDDMRVSWSVAKSFLSALIGILHHDGTIPDLDVPVTQYVPTLAGTAYEGATIRNVLNMASGVQFDEDYLAFFSDINKMGREIALGGSLDDFAAGLEVQEHSPGEIWQYVSIDTHVIGMVIRGASGREIPDLLSEKIIAPLGFQSTPYYLTDGDGTSFVLGGLNMPTRDYARFGLMFANGGSWKGEQIVPAEWIAASTAPSAPTAPGEIGYGFQWWVPVGAQPGEYMARGVYGQYIYINTAKDVVIATNAADRKFRQDGVAEQNVAIFREITASLD